MQDPRTGRLPLHQLHPQHAADLPNPPFTASFRNYLIIGLEYARSAVRHLVPAELDLPDPVTGFVATGRADSGWGVGPFSNFYLALAVGGLPSPDGTPAHFRPLNLYSAGAARVFAHHYNHLMQAGDHRHVHDGGLLTADIAGAGLTVRLQVRIPSDQPPQPIQGVHHYLGQDSRGEITSFHTSYQGDFVPAEVLVFDVGGRAAARLPPPRVQWATLSPRLQVTIGEPRGSPFAALAGVEGAAALTGLLARIGVAAACLGPEGVILSANAAARALLWPVGRTDLARLAQLQGPDTLKVAADRPPVLVQGLPIGPGLIDRPARLIVVRDPAAPAQGDASALLELLGLTPAEARLAATVGLGLAPAVAAERLGIRPSTARSQLKVVFDKLALSRQSELSRLVSILGPG